MGSTARSWVVAASIGAVEALKDQGICRWNYTLRSLHQHAKTQMRSVAPARRLSSQSAAAVSGGKAREDRTKKAEESLRKVMYLSCWGPN